jgi:hypothetical protein
MTPSQNDESVHLSEGSIHNSARAIVMDKSKLLWVFIGINLAATLWMFAEWRLAEREQRMVEYYQLEIDGKLIASGILKPSDSWSARKGQAERENKK